MCKAGNSERPTVCEVEGCEGTNRISYHKLTGLYACHACRLRYGRKGTFAYYEIPKKPSVCKRGKRPTVCQVEGCEGTKRVYRHRQTGIYACRTCQDRYRRTGSFAGAGSAGYGNLVRAIGKCENCGETYRLQKISELGIVVCGRCRSTYSRMGHLPGLSRDTIERVLTGVECECGAPATQAIDLSGAAVINFPKGDLWTTQRWMVFVCDECAQAEHEIQHHQGWSDYRPTGYFNSREAGR